MKPIKRRGLFNFLCAFVPGACEMHMGFMKMGFSLMAIFFATFGVLCTYLRGELALAAAMVIWCYGFFHARNLTAMDPDDFAKMEDNYIWDEFKGGNKFEVPAGKVKKWIAICFIIFGVSVIWRDLTDTIISMVPREYAGICWTIVDEVPRMLIAILLVIAGVYMIKGKKKQLQTEAASEKEAACDVSQVTNLSVQGADNAQNAEAQEAEAADKENSGN